MYAYFAKGLTVGHVLTRVVLREITSIPGIILDLILAMFWVPNYSSYWREGSSYIEYADRTRHYGVMRGIFGWVGEALGFVIGAPIGAIIGTVLFFPDLLLQGLIFLKKKLENSLDDFAVFIGKTTFFESLVYDKPTSFLQKAWNIGTATIGMSLAAIPFIIAKALEFFLPFLSLSQPIVALCSAIGGLSGWALGILISPPAYFISKCIDLLELGRTAILHGVALVYAKSGETPVTTESHDYDCCIPAQAIHSEEFYKQVDYYSHTSWAQLLFGPLKGEASSAQRKKEANNQLIDPFTLEPLGINGTPTVIDPHGHTFNDDKGTGKGIRFWVQTKHECPLDHQFLKETDLVPNRAFDDLIAQTNHSYG
ncbi:Uncharacterised protein [Legionella steigerwaltii]|uniref:Transmembrane protein n=1 Tax=Legionella steigerwaltii TaxID=460 RepID=A0A378L9U4_9GAMM|nr:hypothetical protein [Legionella steigerwaltii]KTD77496.1 hypothetical protein Lstg_1853 [Legionella steigerwaltii]STY22648.1 Uncharacterised protein [Legionella steigerwaltii]